MHRMRCLRKRSSATLRQDPLRSRRHGEPDQGTALDLYADRTSCHNGRPNQLRLMLGSLAYVLFDHIRRVALKHTRLANATSATIRNKLIRIGAVISFATPEEYASTKHVLSTSRALTAIIHKSNPAEPEPNKMCLTAKERTRSEAGSERRQRSGNEHKTCSAGYLICSLCSLRSFAVTNSADRVQKILCKHDRISEVRY